MTDPDDDRVDANELGLWLGVTSAAVRDAARRGVLERDGRHFALQASVQRDRAHLRRLVIERAESPAAAERARLTRAQAVLASLKAQRLGRGAGCGGGCAIAMGFGYVLRACALARGPFAGPTVRAAPDAGGCRGHRSRDPRGSERAGRWRGKSSETDGFSAMTDEAANPPS